MNSTLVHFQVLLCGNTDIHRVKSNIEYNFTQDTCYYQNIKTMYDISIPINIGSGFVSVVIFLVMDQGHGGWV